MCVDALAERQEPAELARAPLDVGARVGEDEDLPAMLGFDQCSQLGGRILAEGRLGEPRPHLTHAAILDQDALARVARGEFLRTIDRRAEHRDLQL